MQNTTIPVPNLASSAVSGGRIPSATDAPRSRPLSRQTVTLTLEGVTPSDYLAWACDPEPEACGLVRVEVAADVHAQAVVLDLTWACEPPSACAGARAAGFIPGADVVAVRDVVERV